MLVKCNNKALNDKFSESIDQFGVIGLELSENFLMLDKTKLICKQISHTHVIHQGVVSLNELLTIHSFRSNGRLCVFYVYNANNQ